MLQTINRYCCRCHKTTAQHVLVDETVCPKCGVATKLTGKSDRSACLELVEDRKRRMGA